MAWAIMLPISTSLAEMVATCAFSSFVLTGREFFLSSLTTSSRALCMPRWMDFALAPAVMLRMPSLSSDCVSTIAVVVPSPATSLVLEATSRTSWAPMFS